MPERATTGTTSRTVAIQGERGSFSHAAVLELLGTDWMPQPNPHVRRGFPGRRERAGRARPHPVRELAGRLHPRELRSPAGASPAAHHRRDAAAHPAVPHRAAREHAGRDPPRGLAPGRPRPVPDVLRRASGSGGDRDLRHRGQRDGPAARRSCHPGRHRARPAPPASTAARSCSRASRTTRRTTRASCSSAREPVPGRTRPSKTSIVFTDQERARRAAPGARRFASRGADLAKIESRPLKGPALGVLVLSSTCSGDPNGAVAEALAELRGVAHECAHPGVLSRRRRRHRQRDQEPLGARYLPAIATSVTSNCSGVLGGIVSPLPAAP